MPKIKQFFRLVVMELFYVGHWDHYPTDGEIIEAMDKRYNGKRELDGHLITFRVEKLQYLEDKQTPFERVQEYNKNNGLPYFPKQ